MADEPAELHFDSRRNTEWLGIPESLVDDSRRTIKHGLGHTDNPEHISTRLCHDACSRAFALKVSYLQIKDGDDLPIKKEGLGQVGFIRTKPISVSPGSRPHYAVTPFTAKHNLRRIENVDHHFYPADAIESTVYLKGDLSEKLLLFDDLNVSVKNDAMVLRQCALTDAVWGFGVDVSAGNPVSNRSDGITNRGSSFQVYEEGYDFGKDQRVGIAVFTTVLPTAKSASPDPDNPLKLTPVELSKIYGNAFEANIYTGKITFVGKHEYDLNSFSGCSGAIVFLLDKNQPDTLQSVNYGRAIAVHVGTHPLLSDRNFAFKLMEDMIRGHRLLRSG
ncbi:expressed unknown protein [Seminavis robusta]|uniref:Uncharacterized protein n=1 Tax=Seminavis robusta TaxID=568900 RepID=A0A9N8DUJ1_9STRA|nr:expressed unknown protein [Seminavis robusta]|eukprot:Sro286_g108410.1 n/a (333) ;mRNA; f:66450-67448